MLRGEGIITGEDTQVWALTGTLGCQVGGTGSGLHDGWISEWAGG